MKKMSSDISRATIPSICQPKYDGEFVIWNGEKLINRNGRQHNLPLCKHLPASTKLIGELYYGDGKKNFYEASTHLKADSPLLNLALFGMYDTDKQYVNQMQDITYMYGLSDGQIHAVEGMTAYSYAEIDLYCKDYIDAGWEGAVVKPSWSTISDSWIKVKDTKTADLVVVGVSKGKYAIAVGNAAGYIYGHCSLYGNEDIEALIKDKKIVGRDSEHYYIDPSVVVEVEYQQVIRSGRGISLRSPRLLRAREDLNINDAENIT